MVGRLRLAAVAGRRTKPIFTGPSQLSPKLAEGDIVNCESVPGKTGTLSVSYYFPHSTMAIHYVPLRPYVAPATISPARPDHPSGPPAVAPLRGGRPGQ